MLLLWLLILLLLFHFQTLLWLQQVSGSCNWSVLNKSAQNTCYFLKVQSNIYVRFIFVQIIDLTFTINCLDENIYNVIPLSFDIFQSIS